VLRDDARILVLQVQQLGDTLAAWAIVRAVHRRYPGATIDIIASPVAAAVYARYPHLGRIHAIPPSATVAGRAMAWARAIRAVRRERYDCVLACTNHVSLRHGLLAWLTGAPERIGFDRAGRGFLFTTRLAVQPERSCYEENMDLARAVDCAIAATDHGPEQLAFNSVDERHVSALLIVHRVPDDRPLIVFHPGANWQSKLWYADRWGGVADTLADEGYYPLFVGVEREAPLVQEIRHAMRCPSASLVGETTVSELAALLGRAALFVGTDSGPRHLAAAVGCRQVTIMSAQDAPGRWRIPGARETVLRSTPPCAGCLRRTCSHRQCLGVILTEDVLAACSAQGGTGIGRPDHAINSGATQ
jgi:ADP-heptose:LPS heptosyltransferase